MLECYFLRGTNALHVLVIGLVSLLYLLALLLPAGAQEDDLMSINRPIAVKDIALSNPHPTTARPLPRDGEIAIREEFAAAVVKGETAALELFIRRHPQHKLAEIAQIMLVRGVFGPLLPKSRD